MTRWIRRLAAFSRRRRLDDQLAEEIRTHLALRTQALIDAGMPAAEAAREARRRFGNPTLVRERARDERSLLTVDSVLQDLRVGGRGLIRRPGYAAAVVATIALGTGLNGAVFVLFNAAILRTPDVADAARVVRVDDGRPTVGPSYPDYVDYRDRAGTAIDLAAFSGVGVTARLDPRDTATSRVTAVLASGNYFAVLDVAPILGRTFTGGDDLPPSGTPVVVLGEAYWTRRFNRDPGVIGRTIELNLQPFTVIGVIPAGFRGVEIAGGGSPAARELYVPLWCLPLLQPGDGRLGARTTWWGLQAVGRLRPGVSVEQGRGQLASIAAALDREYPGQRPRRTPWAQRLTDVDLRLLAGEIGLLAGAMGAATLLVLCIACANVANLTLARTVDRSREIAVRLSLGAGRRRVVRQFLTESLILAAGGTSLGFALAHWGLRAATTSADSQPFVLRLEPDIVVALYAGAIAIVVALVTGLVPALQASKVSMLPALKETASGYRASWMRAMFIGGEAAVCLLLLVTTMLLLRSAQRAGRIDPVLPVQHLLAVAAEDSGVHGYTGDRQAALLEDLERRIASLPGITATAVATPVPFSGNRHGTRLRRIDSADQPGLGVFLSNVSPAFFPLANLPVVRGRVFDAGAGDEIVVNQTLATRLWGTADPIGQRVTAGDFDRTTHVVVGVVRDAPFVSLRLRAEPFMFRPIDPARGGTVIARTAPPASTLLRAAAVAAAEADPQLRVAVEAVDSGLAQEIAAVRAGAGVLGGMGGLALLLALFGVGAVTAGAVAQRTHEIGVRMALGARTADATAMMVRQSMRPVLGGILVGLAASALLGRLLASQLYGLSGVDPVAFGSAALFLCVAAVVAAWIPARRAARVDPLIALRAE